MEFIISFLVILEWQIIQILGLWHCYTRSKSKDIYQRGKNFEVYIVKGATMRHVFKATKIGWNEEKEAVIIGLRVK